MKNLNRKIYVIILEFIVNFDVAQDSYDKGASDFSFRGFEGNPSELDHMNSELAEIAQELFNSVTSIESTISESLLAIRKELNIDDDECDERILELEEYLSELN